MKTFTLLPIVLTGVVGSVFLIQLQTAPAVFEGGPRGARAAETRAAESTAPPQVIHAMQFAPLPTVEPRHEKLYLAGRVVSNRDLDIKSKTSGQVLNVAVDVGENVKKGQLLVELDATDATRSVQRCEAVLAASRSRLTQAKESLAIAEMSLDAVKTRAGACVKAAGAKATRARSRADRYKATLIKNVISQEEYDEAEASAVEAAANLDISRVQLEDVKTQERSLALKREDVACAEAQVTIDEITLKEAQQRQAETKVYACLDGMVTARSIQPGQIVSAGSSSAETRLLTISDLSRIYVSAAVNASQFGLIKSGQKATMQTDACPGKSFLGTVVRVAPRGTASGQDVSFDIKIEVMGENKALLKPEMPVCVEFP